MWPGKGELKREAAIWWKSREVLVHDGSRRWLLTFFVRVRDVQGRLQVLSNLSTQELCVLGPEKPFNIVLASPKENQQVTSANMKVAGYVGGGKVNRVEVQLNGQLVE